jgi:3-oxoadipate enol-lactonase
MDAEHHSIANRHGTRLAWRSFGSPDAPAVVMMHSLGFDATMWTPQIQALSATFRLIAVDTRGHGRSEAPAGPYRLDDLGNDVIEIVDAAAVDRFHVLGLSLGGQMAMWLALNAPRRVQSVVLANTGAKIGTTETWQSRIDVVTSDGMGSIRDAVLARWFAPGFATEHHTWFADAQRVLEMTDPIGYAGCSAALRDSDLRSTVGQISAPTLVIGGALDVATPPTDAQFLHDSISSSELTILDNAAHISNLDRHDAFTERVTTFLGLRRRTPTRTR